MIVLLLASILLVLIMGGDAFMELVVALIKLGLILLCVFILLMFVAAVAG